MEKLELKHIAPYLPYGLKVQYLVDETIELVGFNRNTIYHTKGFFVELPCNLKPILRPLSDLTKHECFNILSDNLQLSSKIFGLPNYFDLKVSNYNILLENHFDIFGLIPKGLAIDINTLK